MPGLHPHPEPPIDTPVFAARFRVRSYELDAFGHVNHAVYFNYFEAARFQALAEAGLDLGRARDRGWAIHLVHAEADFRREASLGDEMDVLTWVADTKRSSMSMAHVAHDPADPSRVFATGRVVAVWVGSDGRPMRIPDEVRRALGGVSTEDPADR